MRTAVFCLSLLGLAATPTAQAADWLHVAREKGRSVDLDRASVLDSDAGTKVAWGRIVLADEEVDAAGYKTIKALNRYDCRSQTFLTVKRVYLDRAGLTIREEPAGTQKPIAIQPGTLDDRFFKEVCKPASLQQLAKVAEAAEARARSQVAPAPRITPPTAPVQHADLQMVKEEAHPEPPAEKPITGGKPLIQLPPKPAPKAAEPAHAEAAPPPPPTTAPRYYRPPPPRRPAPPPASRDAPPVQMAVPAINPHAHWSYEGETGPQNWGRMKPEFATCASGARQSPIDVRDGIKVDLEPIKVDYKPSYFRIVDNGHTIQVTVGPGLNITVMGKTYELQQFHFHRPAEERIDGRAFDMVVHLVHKDLDGKLAVIAVLLDRGTAHPVIQTLWNNLPLEKNESYQPPVAINPADLLPADRGYITYMGSLTTPPCTEGVLWMVMKQPVQVSPEQIAIFSRFYRNNARPIQQAGDRIIKESR
ncbi:carbonic anhydrase [Niveibacterium microcysteis]|nr:carbonic anhydrase family protein [Niveibacterium microcysteis]